jgi:RNA polymerase sigma-70 factor, ECF subfamily
MIPHPNLAANSPSFSREQLLELLPGLRARALKLCLSASEAQDVVQDTLERSLRFQDSYEAGTNLRAWTHRILFSVFVTHCRRRRRERRALALFTGDPCAWTCKDETPPMTGLLGGLEQRLAELPAQFGAVVKLVDLHDCSYKEAALELGVPVGTVMSRLFRGRRLLAASLAEAVAPPARAA